MIEYESVKGLFFEHAKDMQFKVLPYYTETLDKTYIHKLFFVDIDMWNSNLKFSNFELENTDVSYNDRTILFTYFCNRSTKNEYFWKTDVRRNIPSKL